MKKIAILAIIAIVAVMSSQVFADDVIISTMGDPIEIDWIGGGAYIQVAHDDSDPHKGSAYVAVKNTGNDPWGDFHFFIYDPDPLDAYTVENVHFLDSSMIDHDGFPGEDPTSSQTLSPPWYIDNAHYDDSGAIIVGATMDLYFYSDSVLVDDIVWFEIYTDNADELSSFGLAFHPTPVPEPATIAILGLGGLALSLRRKK